jgi:hypothetical protein
VRQANIVALQGHPCSQQTEHLIVEALRAAEAGVYKPDRKAAEFVAWLKPTCGLGHGLSMAIWAVFKDEGWVDSPTGKK